MSSDYPAFGKIPRLFRDIVITEKIDGTNGLIAVYPNTVDFVPDEPGMVAVGGQDGENYIIRAGSRNRWLSVTQDNFGFAAWVDTNAEALVDLGPGLHYGEWWGSGIQRGYGLTKGEKRFSLFNTSRWGDNLPSVLGLGVVPKLYEGPNTPESIFNESPVEAALYRLEGDGSFAAPGFMRPEGIIVYHTAARTYSKVTLDNDGKPKGQS